MTNTRMKAQARAVLGRHAKSFRWASLFLDAMARDRAAIVYAFCRHVDDVVDESTDMEAARKELDMTVEMLQGLKQPSVLVAAFLEVAQETGFGIEPALDLIEGMRSDLGPVRMADDEELFVYCYRVAGTVGVMMCHILGARGRDAQLYAIDLGIAMQLTNICRDVLEDAQRNRTYLPLERLRKAGLDAECVVQHARHPASSSAISRIRVADVVRQLLSTADTKYETARKGYVYLPPRARLSIMVASKLYRHIGILLRDHRACDPLLGRVSVSPSEKVRLTARAILEWASLTPMRARFETARNLVVEALVRAA